MKPEKNQGGLLIRLQELAGCQYLSDLHNSFYIEDVLYALRRINIASYSLDEWREAIRYILGEDLASKGLTGRKTGNRCYSLRNSEELSQLKPP